MRVEVLRGFRGSDRDYQVGEVIDLSDSLAQELLFTRRVRVAKDPPPRRRKRKAPTESET